MALETTYHRAFQALELRRYFRIHISFPCDTKFMDPLQISFIYPPLLFHNGVGTWQIETLLHALTHSSNLHFLVLLGNSNTNKQKLAFAKHDVRYTARILFLLPQYIFQCNRKGAPAKEFRVSEFASLPIGPTCSCKVYFACPPYTWCYKSRNGSAWHPMCHSSGIKSSKFQLGVRSSNHNTIPT